MGKKEVGDFLSIAFIYVVAFVFGGTGLYILYNYNNQITSVIGAFFLIGLAVAIIKKQIDNG